MDTQMTGQCLVCGKETKNRCSSCAKAGIDLFFCSPEHQKLAWSMHRMFCGLGKANPFRWPPLSPDEVRDAIEMLDTSDQPGRLDEVSYTLAQKLLSALNVSRDDLPAFIRLLSKPSTLPLEIEAVVLRSIRLHVSVRREFAGRSSNEGQRLEPMLFLISLAFASDVYRIPSSWTTSYMHRLAVYTAVRYGDEQALQRYGQQMIRSTFQYLDDMARDDPANAAKAVNGLRMFLPQR